MPNSHGGKRANAGRKTITEAKLSQKTITLSAADIQYLQSINTNISAAIRELIARARS